MEINKRLFPTKRSALRFVSNFLQNTPRLEPEDAAWLIRDVLSLHPRWAEKSKGMKGIAIKQQGRPGNNMFVIQKHNGTEEDISYRTCITKQNDRVDVTKALRFAVISDISEYRRHAFSNERTIPCADCNAPCENAHSTHIDHILPFRTIVANFVSEENIDLNSIQTHSSGTYRLISDIDLRMRWTDYHKKHATLRVMCARCNLKRG